MCVPFPTSSEAGFPLLALQLQQRQRDGWAEGARGGGEAPSEGETAVSRPLPWLGGSGINYLVKLHSDGVNLDVQVLPSNMCQMGPFLLLCKALLVSWHVL